MPVSRSPLWPGKFGYFCKSSSELLRGANPSNIDVIVHLNTFCEIDPVPGSAGFCALMGYVVVGVSIGGRLSAVASNSTTASVRRNG